jgi:hypothetical protein
MEPQRGAQPSSACRICAVRSRSSGAKLQQPEPCSLQARRRANWRYCVCPGTVDEGSDREVPGRPAGYSAPHFEVGSPSISAYDGRVHVQAIRRRHAQAGNRKAAQGLPQQRLPNTESSNARASARGLRGEAPHRARQTHPRCAPPEAPRLAFMRVAYMPMVQGQIHRASMAVARVSVQLEAFASATGPNRGFRARQEESVGQASIQMAQVSVLQEQVYGEAVVSSQV